MSQQDTNDKNRYRLMTLFYQKSNAHIGYLIATSLAFVGFSNQYVLDIFHFKFIMLFFIFVLVAIYFLGRAMFWSQMATASIYVRPYEYEEFFKVRNLNKNDYEKTYAFDPLFLMKQATADLALRENKFKKEKITIHNTMNRLFDGYKIKILFAVIIGILIATNYLFYKCIPPFT
jgi:hypothetical protein